MEQLRSGIWLAHADAAGFPTVSVALLTRRRAFVIDTLTRPADMDPVVDLWRERAGARRVVVVNTHHHWDHVHGNAAFAGEDIVAHVACRRLLLARPVAGGEPVPPAPPEGVPLPSITFHFGLDYVDEDDVVRLIHAPGHSEDSVAVFVRSTRILFAGDALEWPLPSFSRGGRAQAWLRTIAMLRQLGADLIVPSHGPPMGGTLLDANERYIAGLVAAVRAAKQSGAGAEDLDLPVSQFVGPGVEVDGPYVEVHAANLARIWSEV